MELLGPLSGSGYRRPQALVRRADGQTLQLTPALYALLELLDGQRDSAALARELSASLGKQASPSDVETLLERLRPLGVLAGTESGALGKPEPLLGLRLRFVITDPKVTGRIAAPFARLFSPYLVVPALCGFAVVCWFVLVEKGLASGTRQAFLQPELLLGVFVVTVLSAGFHELGHAAACRYGGASPGAMGAGLYLVWPAFYTDVDDSYRLSRWGRLRVDLGGLYFNVLVADAVLLVWLVWRQDALLLVVATQLLQMLQQLGPFVRADGYHLLADLTGVPDLFHHLGPTLRRLLPWNWREPVVLRRPARWTVTAWTLLVVPLLFALVVAGVLLFPRLVATAWEGGRLQLERLALEDPIASGAALLKLAALLVPVVAVALMTTRIVSRVCRRVWRATAAHPRRRAVSLVAALVAAMLLAGAWWPQGQYESVRADERGTLGSLPSIGSQPAQHDERLALALLPRAAPGPAFLLLTGDGGGTQAVLTAYPEDAQAESTSPTSSTGWAFPFRLPEPPGPGDNQALAVGDRDGATAYDVAYALVTVTDSAAVTNQNAAYALASCSYCTTVAVAFQVVLVIGQADVVVPVNTAVAANADCLSCITTAFAVQIVATLQELPSAEVYAQLQQALQRLEGLEGLDTATLWEAVQAVETEVVRTLVDAGLVEGVSRTTVTATATPTASASPPPTSSPSTAATSDPSPTGTPEAASSATPTATPTPPSSSSPSP